MEKDGTNKKARTFFLRSLSAIHQLVWAQSDRVEKTSSLFFRFLLSFPCVRKRYRILCEGQGISIFDGAAVYEEGKKDDLGDPSLPSYPVVNPAQLAREEHTQRKEQT